jgi:hypothetical protein
MTLPYRRIYVKNQGICKESKIFFGILDCTQDASHTEQIAFVVRIENTRIDTSDVAVRELFLGFYPVSDTTREGLCNYLLSEL